MDVKLGHWQEASLVRWYRRDGELVRKDEPICEFEVPEATVDWPAPNEGVLRQLVKAGEMVQPYTIFAQVDPVD